MSSADTLPRPFLLKALLQTQEELQEVQLSLKLLPRNVSAKQHRLLIEEKSNLSHRLAGLEVQIAQVQSTKLYKCDADQLGRVIQGLLNQVDGTLHDELATQIQNLLTHSLLICLIEKDHDHASSLIGLFLAVAIQSSYCHAARVAIEALRSPVLQRLTDFLNKELDSKQRVCLQSLWTNTPVKETQLSQAFETRRSATTDAAIEYWIMSQPWLTQASLIRQSKLLDGAEDVVQDEQLVRTTGFARNVDEDLVLPSAPESTFSAREEDGFPEFPEAPKDTIKDRHAARQAAEADDVAQELDAQRLIQIYTGKSDDDRFDNAMRATTCASEPVTPVDSSDAEDYDESEPELSDEETRVAVAKLLAEVKSGKTNSAVADDGDKTLDALMQEAREALEDAAGNEQDDSTSERDAT
jgi:hypothetical protein